MNVSDLTYAVEGLAGEGWFDGYSVMQWFRKRAREAGVHFVTGEAAGYRTRANLITHVELKDGREIAGDKFVNASGAWCAALAKSVGVDLPVRPWPVAVITLKNRTLSPIAQRFIDHVRAFTNSMGAGLPSEKSPLERAKDEFKVQ